MKSIFKSFRRRVSIVMIFFAMAPISFFGFYAYNNLSQNRMEQYEQSFYYALANDMQSFNLWLEDRKAHMHSDANLFLLTEQAKDKGSFENRPYEVFYEGDPQYQSIYAKMKQGGSSELFLELKNFSGLHQVADERTVLRIYLHKLDLRNGKHFFIKEEIHLKEILRNLEKALGDRFVNYSIFINDQVVFENKSVANLDPYDAYFNQQGYISKRIKNKYYMGIYQGSDYLGIHAAVYRDYTEAVLDIKDYQLKFILQTILIGLFGAIFALFIARKVNNPIDLIKAAVAEILSGKYEKRIEVKNNDEFGQIYEAFNHLAEIETSNFKKMVEAGHQIGEKNTMLIEINQELEQSYDRLREVMTQLDVSRKKQEALIHNIGELIWTMNPEGIITFLNQAISDKLGYPLQKLHGEPIHRLIAEVEGGMSLEQLLDKANYMDIESQGVFFKRYQTDERVYMLLSTKRASENKGQKSIQCFARTISDDWILHHMTMRRNKEMEITGQISWVLANNILLDELLEEIVKKIEQLLSPDLCLIGLVEESEAVIGSIGGAYSKHLGRIRLAVGSELFIEELAQSSFIRGEEIYQYFRVGNESIYQAITDYVIIPLKFDDKITGFFTIGSSKKMSESDLKVLQIVSNQSAIAIDKAKLYRTLKDDYLNTIRVLATAVEAKDAYTEGHSYRVSKIARLIAEELSADETFIEDIEISGILHDIGKIGIYDKILTKRGKLSEEEYGIIQSHPEIGSKIISPINLSQTIINGVHLHHKRYDLTGYPKQVIIESLPLSAGIIGVADAVDAMTSTRSYSQAKTIDYAIEEVMRHSGTQFHPVAASALAAILEKYPNELLKIIHEQA